MTNISATAAPTAGDALNRWEAHISEEVESHKRALEFRTMPLDTRTRGQMQPHLELVVREIEYLEAERDKLRTYLDREAALQVRIATVRSVAITQAKRIALIRARLPENIAKALDDALADPKAALAASEPEPEPVPEPIPEVVEEEEEMPPCDYPQIRRVNDSALKECPQYVKGRLTVERIAVVVDKMNEFIREKYSIASISSNRKLRGADRDRWAIYKENETKETEGTTFITDGELRTYSTFKMDATARSTINVLRHLGSIKEVRGKNKARYFIIKS